METEEPYLDFRQQKEQFKKLIRVNPDEVKIAVLKIIDSVKGLVGKDVRLELSISNLFLHKTPVLLVGRITEYNEGEGHFKLYSPTSTEFHVFVLGKTRIHLDENYRIAPTPDLCHMIRPMQIDRVWLID